MKRVEDGARAKPKAKRVVPGAKPIEARKGETVAVLLSGGNPRVAKAEGDAPVQAYIAAMPGWKRDLGERLDALIGRAVAKSIVARHIAIAPARRGVVLLMH